MHFFSTLLAGAACIAAALAQTPPIAFTSVPAVVVAGSTYNITWGGGDGISPVTITLRKGNPSNLQTISTLTSSGSDGYYLWTPSSSLATGSDYALQITQGQSDINYSGLFALVGGSGSSSISYSGTSTIATNTSSTVSTTVGGTAASLGTGTTMARNTTFSSMTLSSTSSSVARTSSGTSRSGSESGSATATSTATSTAETTAPTGGAAQLVSSAALLLGAFVALISFN